MSHKPRLLRITTVPISLHKLIAGQMSYMKSQGFEVAMLSAAGPEVSIVKEKEGCPHFSIPMSRKITPIQDLISLVRLFLLFKRWKPDIVHTHTPKAGLLGMLAASMARVPVRIHTIAGLPWSEKKGGLRALLKLMERITIFSSHRIFVNSKGLLNFMQEENLVANSSKCKIIGKGSSNGIDTKWYSKKSVTAEQISALRLSVPEDGFVWLFVGRLVGDKGIGELLDAFYRVLEYFPSDVLWLVGDHEERDALSLEIKEKIASHPSITLFGWQDDVRPYLAAADCLVFPSYREGFPNVPLQAAAMECPMILSNINGCNEIVEDHVNGLLVEPKNALALLQAMLEVRGNLQLASEMAVVARERVVRDFDQLRIWQSIEREYRELLGVK